MAEQDLPPEVRELVTRLHGMEEIEVVILLSGEARSLSIEEIRDRLRIPASTLPMASLGRLVANRLVAEEKGEDVPRYFYDPATPELRRAVDLLTTAYNERPVTLVRFVYSSRTTAAQSFADAFRVRKEGGR